MNGPLVTVFGARRTGTNVTAWLLTENFRCRVDPEAWGHKHYEQVTGVGNEVPLVVVCVRHPLAWLAGLRAHWNQVRRNRGLAPRRFTEWLENEPAPEQWSTRYRAWLDLPGHLLTKLEDLNGGQARFLKRAQRKWGLASKHDAWVICDRRFGKSGLPRADRFSPREWEHLFDGPTRDSLRERFDMKLVQGFGYSI